MAIGERIRFFRNLRGMTQKHLGMQVGFPEKTADIRMAQYESGPRTPKADLTNNLAEVFGISAQALTVPDIDSDLGLMHTLFTLEDLYGMRAENVNGEVHLCFDENKPTASKSVFAMLAAWAEQAEKYRNGEITKEQYDEWRYTLIPHKLGRKYPRRNSTMQWSKRSKTNSKICNWAKQKELTDTEIC